MRSATGERASDNLRSASSRHVSGNIDVADPNRALFESVVRLLAPLLEELVFVGGCTTGLFVTDPATGGIRPTKDVDAIVDVTLYAQYTALSARLRTLGLVEDTSEGAPLCRWRKGIVIVDVMPVDPTVLGFTNLEGEIRAVGPAVPITQAMPLSGVVVDQEGNVAVAMGVLSFAGGLALLLNSKPASLITGRPPTCAGLRDRL